MASKKNVFLFLMFRDRPDSLVRIGTSCNDVVNGLIIAFEGEAWSEWDAIGGYWIYLHDNGSIDRVVCDGYDMRIIRNRWRKAQAYRDPKAVITQRPANAPAPNFVIR